MTGNIPYIGSKISLITTSDIRYEGILYTLNREESTIAVQNVRSFGTEGRRCLEVPMSNEIYDFIIFRGKDLKDLTVLQGAPERPAPFAVGSEFLEGHSGVPYGHAGPHNDPLGSFQAPVANFQRSFGSAVLPPRNGYVPATASSSSYPVTARPTPSMASAGSSSRPSERSVLGSSSVITGGGAETNADIRGNAGVAPNSGRFLPTEPPPPPPAFEDSGSLAASRGAAEEPKVMAARGSEPKERPAESKEQKARGRGKGGNPKKPLYEVLRFHKRAEEAIMKMMRSQNSSSLPPSELRAMSETNPSVYHFYLDFVNYCCPSHMVQSDEQQWESVCKALQKHFEKEFGAHQSQKPPQPQRPNNTLGDFITVGTDCKASKKSVKVTRGGSRVGRGAGRTLRKEADDPSLGELEGSGSQEDSGAQTASWVCPRCTLRNEDLLLECVACGTSKQQAALWTEFPPLG